MKVVKNSTLWPHARVCTIDELSTRIPNAKANVLAASEVALFKMCSYPAGLLAMTRPRHNFRVVTTWCILEYNKVEKFSRLTLIGWQGHWSLEVFQVFGAGGCLKACRP